MRAQAEVAAPGADARRRHRGGDPARRTRSVDVVTVAQAFHWFDAAGRARRDRPRAAARRSARDPLERARRAHRLGRGDEPDHPLARAHGVALPAHRLGRGRGGRAATSRRSHEQAFPWEQPLTRELLADRVRSISYIAAMPTAERERHAAEVVALVAAAPEPFPLPVRVPRAVVPAVLTDRQAAVLGWWDGQRRELPWRQTRDPWEVLVCEVMAQQTQVARVAERWRPFLDRFPTPAALAAVPAAEVVRWWSGLGYNRRALALHRTAQAVVRDHGGRLPGRPRRAPRAAGHRPVHRPRRAGLRLRGRPRDRRHQHGAGAGPLGGSPPRAPRRCRRPPTRPSRRARRGRGTRRCSTSARRVCRRRDAALRRLPGRRRLRVGAAGCRRARPRRRLGGRVRWPVAASRAATARAGAAWSRRCARGTVAAAELATAMGWPDDPDRARARRRDARRRRPRRLAADDGAYRSLSS